VERERYLHYLLYLLSLYLNENIILSVILFDNVFRRII